jgi:hypothetical protein
MPQAVRSRVHKKQKQAKSCMDNINLGNQISEPLQSPLVQQDKTNLESISKLKFETSGNFEYCTISDKVYFRIKRTKTLFLTKEEQIKLVNLPKSEFAEYVKNNYAENARGSVYRLIKLVLENEIKILNVQFPVNSEIIEKCSQINYMPLKDTGFKYSCSDDILYFKRNSGDSIKITRDTYKALTTASKTAIEEYAASAFKPKDRAIFRKLIELARSGRYRFFDMEFTGGWEEAPESEGTTVHTQNKKSKLPIEPEKPKKEYTVLEINRQIRAALKRERLRIEAQRLKLIQKVDGGTG